MYKLLYFSEASGGVLYDAIAKLIKKDLIGREILVD